MVVVVEEEMVLGIVVCRASWLPVEEGTESEQWLC